MSFATNSTSLSHNATWDANSAVVSAAIAVGAILVSKGFILSIKNNNDTKKKGHEAIKKAPPRVPTSFFGCVSALNDKVGLVPALLSWARATDFAPAMSMPLDPSKLVVIISDPTLVKEILKDKTSSKSDIVCARMSTVRGSNIYIQQHDEARWMHARKGVLPAFSSIRVKRMKSVCDDHMHKWIDGVIKPFAERSEAFDPTTELVKMTVGLICKAALEYDASDDEVRQYLKDNEFLSDEIHKRIANPTRAWLQHLLPGARQSNQALKRVTALGRKILEKHRKSPSQTRGTVIDAIDNNPQYEDDAARIRDIDVFLWAGFDTVGYTLSWIMYDLASHPNEMDKVRKAILKVPESDREACIELRNVVKESMRLHPVVAFGMPRDLGREYKTKDGCTLQKGTVAFLPHILANRNPEIYGSDADTFRSDRWNGASDAMKAAFSPFSWGPQNCIGQGLVLNILHSFVAMLVSCNHLEVMRNPTPVFFVTYYPEGGLMKATQLS